MGPHQGDRDRPTPACEQGSVVRRREFLLIGAAVLATISGCARWPVREEDGAASEPSPNPPPGSQAEARLEEPLVEELPVEELPVEEPPAGRSVDAAEFARRPSEWGENVTGVRTRLATDDPVVALTFDACGGRNGSGYDAALIDTLRSAAVPATLFFNQRWIEANERRFLELATDPLFEVANHGTEHRPLSVDGRSVYGITGTASPQEVIDEVLSNQHGIERRTGHSPRHFRSGTAYVDDVAVAIAQALGLEVVNFDVLGDAGATFSANQVTAALTDGRPGSIALLHMNHPSSGTAQGVADAIPLLRDRGFAFTHLGDHDLV